jgi:hypothetical protein
MEMTGEFRIPAPRQRVWEGLNDPEILKSSIPGCQTIEKLSDTEFTAKILAQVGPVKANFACKVTLADLNPPQSYTIAGEGSGGVAGFAKRRHHRGWCRDPIDLCRQTQVDATSSSPLAAIVFKENRELLLLSPRCSPPAPPLRLPRPR